MKKTTLKKIAIFILISAIALSALSACATNKKQAPHSADYYGALILSVNPEIKIEYDENGVVVGVNGINRDGKKLINDESIYIGKNCNDVVKELVSNIYEAGYFAQEVKGRNRNIVIKLENGSDYPEADFLDNIKEAVKAEVGILGLDSSPVTVDEDDYDEFGRISVDKAKEIALEQAGVPEENASFKERDYDSDDNVYEIEFTSEGVDYELEVDASSGKVNEADLELNDDWKKPEADNTEDSSAIQNDIQIEERIDEEAAKAIALEYAQVGVPDYISCEYDDNDYDIEFFVDGTEYDVEVNAYTGEVIDFDVEKKNNAPETQIPSERISKEKAESIALEHAGVSAPDYIKSEPDENEYEIEFKTKGIEYEYEIDAYSGDIISYDSEADDDD